MYFSLNHGGFKKGLIIDLCELGSFDHESYSLEQKITTILF